MDAYQCSEHLDTVNITSGTVNLATADAVSIVNISGGTLQGPGILTVTNSVNWSGGNLNGALTIGTNATFTTGSGGQLSGLTLNNYGTAMWFGGNLNGNAQTIITNYGLWLCQSDNQITFNSGLFPFVNKGTLRKTAYTGATTLTGMSFTNVGVVDAERGNISFQSGGTLTGTYNATNGAAINFNGGTFTLDQTPIFTGGGSFNFQNGSLTLTHDAPAPLNLVGGNVTLGSGVCVAAYHSTLLQSDRPHRNEYDQWDDGLAAGGLNGQLTVAHNGVLNITTGNTKNLSVSALINSGQVN